MKAIVVVLAISFVAVLGHHEFTDEQKAKFEENKKFCINESGVDPTLLEKMKKGEAIDDNDEKFACFSTCMAKKFGIINADGDIDWETARSKLPPSVTQEQADQLYNACKDITGTGCEKGHNLFKCFMENKKFHTQ